MTKHLYDDRLKKIRQKMSAKKVDAYLVTAPANRFYLTGFDGSAGFVVVSGDKLFLAVDSRYTQQAYIQSPHASVYPLKKSLKETLNILAKREGWEIIGFEADHISFADYERLREKKGLSFLPLNKVIEKVRMVKDDYEISLIKKAASITDEALLEIRDFLRPGIKETEIAAELEYNLRKKGASGAAFTFIVASGKRSAWPHGVASEKELSQGELITIDCGVFYGGYVSDITRTFFLGKPGKRELEVWQVVSEARLSALSGIRNGEKTKNIDALARKVISDAGYGKYFGHGLGHGFGIEAHEAPSLSPKGKETLVPGMVVTVEPGIYIPHWGGVRIEDMVLIKEKGYEILSTVPRNLLI